MLLDLTISIGLIDLSFWQDKLCWESIPNLGLVHILAQNFEDVDIIADFQKSWKNFVESGQIWALGIGFVLGYMFRTFTSS